jgi:transposase
LPLIEVIHKLPEHELTCACGCRKHAIGEETSEQLEIVPMQIRVIKYIRKVYDCRGCEAAPVTTDKPAQFIEKSMASPSVLGMLLTTKYVDGLPLHRFEKVFGHHCVDIQRQNLCTLGHPVRRTPANATQLDASPTAGESRSPLRRNACPGNEGA